MGRMEWKAPGRPPDAGVSTLRKKQRKMILTFGELKKMAREEVIGARVRIALLGDSATQLLATAIRGTLVQ